MKMLYTSEKGGRRNQILFPNKLSVSGPKRQSKVLSNFVKIVTIGETDRLESCMEMGMTVLPR